MFWLLFIAQTLIAPDQVYSAGTRLAYDQAVKLMKSAQIRNCSLTCMPVSIDGDTELIPQLACKPIADWGNVPSDAPRSYIGDLELNQVQCSLPGPIR